MTVSPSPTEDTKTEMLAAVEALQNAWQQAEPDAAILKSHADRVAEALTVLCRSYLSLAEKNTATDSLTSSQARTPVAPQSVVPSSEISPSDTTQDRQETIEQSHLAPDPALLQARRESIAAVENCQRALDLFSTIEAAIDTQNLSEQSIASVLVQLQEAIERLPETSLP